MEDCIFCKIVEGKIPCYKIDEDDSFLAFLDIKPINEGHALIIPKKHYRWVWDVEDFGKYWEFTRKVTKNILKNLSAESVHYVTVGEALQHAHIHVVPRYKDDGLGGLPDWLKSKNFSDDEMKKVLDRVRK